MRHALFAFLLSTSIGFGASQQFIFPGYRANDNLGDDLRTTQIVINTNFTELFGRTGFLGTNGVPSAANAAAWRSAIGVDYPTVSIIRYPYLADNTGVTNAAPAINQAISDLSTNGGVILFPPGEYVIAEPIVISGSVNKEVTLQGFASFNTIQTDGPATTLRLGNAVNSHMLVKEIGGRLNIRGIVFDGNRANQTATNLYGIWLIGTNTQTERITIENIVIQSVSGIGLQNDNRETWLKSVHVRDCLGDGIRNTASGDTFWYDILSGFNWGNGIAHIGVPGTGAGVAHMIGGNIFRNGLNGLWLTNSANNTIVDYVIDANNQNGILIEGPSWRSTFVSTRPIVNNYPTWVDGTATPYSSGTYSNVRVSGTNAVGLTFVGCNFFQYESTLTHKPLYQIEDLRTGSFTNFQGIAFTGCNFSEGAMTESGVPYIITNMWANATGEWMLDGVRQYNRYANMIDILTDDMRALDQVEVAVGIQHNAYYSGGWLTRSNGPAFYSAARYDDPIWRFYYAPSNAVDSAITWSQAFAINSTNGYVGVNAQPNLTRFEVIGKAKVDDLETIDGFTANAYYSSGWKYRADGFAYYLQSTKSYSNLVLNVAVSNVADSAISFIPGLTIRENGRAAFPNDVEEHKVYGDGEILVLQNTTTNEPNYLSLKNHLGASDRAQIGFITAGASAPLRINNNNLTGILLSDTAGVTSDGPMSTTGYSVGVTAGIDATYTNLISGVITQRVTVTKGIITALETLP